MRFINTGKTAGYINLEHVAQFSGVQGERKDECWIVMAGVPGATHLRGEGCQMIQDAIDAHEAEVKEMHDAMWEGR